MVIIDKKVKFEKLCPKSLLKYLFVKFNLDQIISVVWKDVLHKLLELGGADSLAGATVVRHADGTVCWDAAWSSR